MTCVYVMQASNGWVKVGASINPRSRGAQIKKPDGVKLRLVWHGPPHSDAGWIEQNVLRLLRPYRVHKREWFKCKAGDAILAVLRVTARSEGRYGPL